MSKPGYGNPPKEHQFKPGQSGNPSGMSREQRLRANRNAEQASRLQEIMVEALIRRVMPKGEVIDDEALNMLAADPQRFLKELIDRGYGTATQSHEHSSPDGTMTPHVITRRVIDPKEDGSD